jgi:hypothetical protein
VAKDAEELATRLRRIAELNERLRIAQADSAEAKLLAARVERETLLLNQPVLHQNRPHKK